MGRRSPSVLRKHKAPQIRSAALPKQAYPEQLFQPKTILTSRHTKRADSCRPSQTNVLGVTYTADNRPSFLASLTNASTCPDSCCNQEISPACAVCSPKTQVNECNGDSSPTTTHLGSGSPVIRCLSRGLPGGCSTVHPDNFLHFQLKQDSLGSTVHRQVVIGNAPSPFDRLDYPSLRQSVYLNQASIGLIGQPAVTAMHTFIDNVARHGNLYMSDREEVAYCETLRERASRLLHCDSTQVAIVASASEILGQLPMLLQPRLKSTILAVSSDFPAITRPWLRLAALRDHTVRFVDDQPNVRFDRYTH